MVHSFRALVVSVSSALLLLAMTASAQFGANVQGTTQDVAGATLPGATVSLLNKDTSVSQTTSSNSDGAFRINSLAPGNYAITATAAGFATQTINFILQTNEQRNVPFALAVGQVATTVDVTSQAPLLDTSDSRNQQTLNPKALEELPVGARNPTSLLTLTPGVVGKGASNGSVNGPAVNFNSENYVDASANGRGANGNQYVVDGLDATSNARAGVLNLTPNVDSLSEITVQVNRYDVDYARTSSIQTVMTTRSGSQDFHGFASAYYTWQALWAKPDFAAVKYPPFHILNTSFGVGGPILRKHKLFFFASIEPYRAITTNTAAVQSFEDPAFVSFAQQTMPNSFGTTVLTKYPVSKVTVTGVSKTAAQLFGANVCGTPAADNIPCGLPVIDSGTFGALNYTHAKQYSGRIDKYFTKDRLYGTIFRNTLLNSTAAARSAFTGTNPSYGLAGQVNETHDFSAKTLNEAGFAALRVEGVNNQTGTFTVPVINITGLGTGFGQGSPLQDFVQHSYHWRDVLSRVVSTHSFKFGYEGLHGKQESFFAPVGAQPSITYTNLINFINDNPYSETNLSYDSLTAQPSPSQNFYAISSWGLFAEDTWQATRRLTLNYGIRYDNFGNAEPIEGTKFSNFYLGSGSSLTERVTDGVLKSQSHYFQHDLNWIFSPRVGAAFDPFGNAQYVVRGGFGLYHDYFNINNAVGGAKTNPPSYVVPTFFNDGSTAPPILGFGTSNTYPFGFQYPKFVGQTLDSKGGIVGSQIGIGGSYQDLKPQTSMIYSIGIERQLGRNMVASATYSGSHSYNLWTAGISPTSTFYGQDVNVYAGDLIQHINCKVTPASGTTAATSSCTGKLTRPNTSFGAITYTLNGARQNYDAFIVAVKGRFAQRAFLTASYTRSRDQDNASAYPTTQTDLYYGPSNYDVPNRFSLGATYSLPGFHNDAGLLGRLTGGYTLSAIVALQSGQPFTVITTTPFSATLKDPAQPATSSNLQYTGSSGDFNADGRNYDFPNVSSYAQKTDRASYKKGLFPTASSGSCPAGQLNGCGPFTLPDFGGEGNEKSNGFRNPGYAQTDLTLEKITKIREGIDFRLRVDAFNILNRPNLGNVDATAGDSTFGQVTNLSGPARNLLLGARVNF